MTPVHTILPISRDRDEVLQVVGEAQPSGDLRVSKDGGGELPGVELQDAEVLVRAAGGNVGPRGVELHTQQGSLIPS